MRLRSQQKNSLLRKRACAVAEMEKQSLPIRVTINTVELL
jgi:hypothetical protein